MRVATWNVLSGRSVMDGMVDDSRFAQSAADLDADVVGLQEVDRDQPRTFGTDQTALVAEALGAEHARFAPALHGTPGEEWLPAAGVERPGPAYGVALVSRLPVRAWHVLHLPGTPTRAPIFAAGTRRVIWVHDEPRVALAAELDTPFGPLTVASTHLSFIPVWNAMQLRRVVRWMRQLPGPRLLVGDLNLPGRFPERISRWRPLATAATFPVPEPRVQLDHLLADGPLPPVRQVASPALPVSDHLPLVVDLAC